MFTRKIGDRHGQGGNNPQPQGGYNPQPQLMGREVGTPGTWNHVNGRLTFYAEAQDADAALEAAIDGEKFMFIMSKGRGTPVLMGGTPGEIGVFYTMSITTTTTHQDSDGHSRTSTRTDVTNYKLLDIQDNGQDKKVVWETETNGKVVNFDIDILRKPGGGVRVEASGESPAPNLCGVISALGKAGICLLCFLPCYPCIDCAIKNQLTSTAAQMQTYFENYTVGLLRGGRVGAAGGGAAGGGAAGGNTTADQLSKLFELYQSGALTKEEYEAEKRNVLDA